MKTLLLLAALAFTSSAALAQGTTVSGTQRSSNPSGTAHKGTGTPQTTMAKRNAGKTVSTAPATGPTRASRSSSTKKSVTQGRGTGSTNIESQAKNSQGSTKEATTTNRNQ